jgi:hypothetical protein
MLQGIVEVYLIKRAIFQRIGENIQVMNNVSSRAAVEIYAYGPFAFLVATPEV